MPFRGAHGGKADVVLEQTADKQFKVMRPFWYDVPDTSTTYEVWKGFKTDLASVPWFFWWLVSSYGHQTRAALVHDTLIGKDARVKVRRKEADWVFYTALEDAPAGEPKGSWIRHQMAWVAVCLFGTMRERAKFLLALFLLNVVLLWFAVFAAIFGGPWWSSQLWWAAAAVAAVAGFLWKYNSEADRRLSGRLWPVGAVALLVVAPAVVTVLLTVLVVLIIETPFALALGRKPSFHPYMRLRV